VVDYHTSFRYNIFDQAKKWQWEEQNESSDIAKMMAELQVMEIQRRRSITLAFQVNNNNEASTLDRAYYWENLRTKLVMLANHKEALYWTFRIILGKFTQQEQYPTVGPVKSIYRGSVNTDGLTN